jgi:hypothetical protein
LVRQSRAPRSAQFWWPYPNRCGGRLRKQPLRTGCRGHNFEVAPSARSGPDSEKARIEPYRNLAWPRDLPRMPVRRWPRSARTDTQTRTQSRLGQSRKPAAGPLIRRVFLSSRSHQSPGKVTRFAASCTHIVAASRGRLKPASERVCPSYSDVHPQSINLPPALPPPFRPRIALV